MPKRYRVIEPSSTHRGEVGTLMDKHEVKQRCPGLGRSDAWYAHWDVLLNLSGKTDDYGAGFKWSEVEAVA